MGIEQSSMSRNLKATEQNGWVKIKTGEDARSRIVTTTPKGNQVHQRAKILWERQQRYVIDVLGEKDATALNKMLDKAIAKIDSDLDRE